MLLLHLETAQRQSMPPRPLSSLMDNKLMSKFKHSKSESDTKDQEVAVITEKIESEESYADRGKQYANDICEIEEKYLISEYQEYLPPASPKVLIKSTNSIILFSIE